MVCPESGSELWIEGLFYNGEYLDVELIIASCEKDCAPESKEEMNNYIETMSIYFLALN